MFSFSWSEYILLCAAALLGIVCVTPYTLELSRDALKKAHERMRCPLWVLTLLQGAQSFVLMAVATGLGLLLAHHLGLSAPLVEGLLTGKLITTPAQAALAPALILGGVSAAVLLLLEITMFWPRLPQVMHTSFPIPAFWKRFLACFYGGLAEELLCRLFLLSLLACAWRKANARSIVARQHPCCDHLWSGSLANHCCAGQADSFVACACHPPQRHLGYLFWQYGLEAAMLVHFTADLVLHLIGDSIARAIRVAEARAQG